jgi:hypothetical protein
MKTKTYLQSFFKTISIAVILMLMFSQFGSQVANASTNEANPLNTTLNPTIEVYPEDNVVVGFDWPENAMATITFHDPGKPEGTQDYTTSVLIGSTGWNPDKKYLYDNLGGNYNIQPGCQVTISVSPSDGGYTKTLIVANLSVGTVDIPGNIISGTADPGVNLWIDAFNSSFTGMSIPVKPDGSWTANFTGTEVNLPGDGVRIYRYDENGDGNATVVDWRLPSFQVYPEEDVVEGFDWPINTTATITLHDPDAPEGTQDYTTSQAVGSISVTFNKTYIYFKLGNIYDIHPGCVVSVSAGGFTKTLTVANLKVTNIDLVNDSISGTTDPNTNLQFTLTNSNAKIVTTSDNQGNWTADFSGIYILTAADGGRIIQYDDDGDATDVDWSLPNFRVYPDGNVVEGNGWPENTTATITFHDPGAPEGTQDYTTSVPVGPTPWYLDKKYLYTNLGGLYDIHPGCVVSVSAGGFTKTLTVANLKVTNIDLVNDSVSGTTDPNTNLQFTLTNSGAKIDTTSDNQGNWTADFSGMYILKAGDGGRILQNDDDGDGTAVDWRVPNPNIEASPTSNYVIAHDWPDGSTLTLTIHAPDSPGPNPTVEATAARDPWNPSDIIAFFPVPPGVQLGPGFILTVEPKGGGTPNKSYTIADVQVTPDVWNNTISGSATPGARVQVYVYFPNKWIDRWTTANTTSGQWTVSFAAVNNSAAYTLKPGDTGWASEYDASGDQSVYDWSVPSSIPYVTSKIDATGGTLATTNNEASLTVPPNAVTGQIDFSITTGPSNYEVDVSQGRLVVVSSYSIQPHGTEFSLPATLTFHWEDADGDGIVDGTPLLENNLVLIKDGVVITPACRVNPNCNTTTNTLTVTVSSLSIFELAAPLDSDGDGLPDNVDACPTQNPHGLDADHDGCTDTAAGLRQLVAAAPVSAIASNNRTSLLAKVDGAISSLKKGNKKAAIGQLQLFISEVQAQRGKKIAIQTADLLIAYARNVIAGIS